MQRTLVAFEVPFSTSRFIMFLAMRVMPGLGALPHPFQPNVYAQMWWQEARHPCVKGTGVPWPPLGSATCMAPVAATSEVSMTATAMPEVQGVSAGVSTRRGSQGWCSSADDAHKHQGTGSFSQPPPPPVDLVPTTPLVTLPPGFQSLRSPDADGSLTGFRPVDCPQRLRVDDAFWSDQEYDNDWVDPWRTQLSSSASRHATLVSHLYAGRELAPEFLEKSPRRSPGRALGSDQRSRRETDKFQVLSWNPGRTRGKDPRACSPQQTMAHNLYFRKCRLRHRQFLAENVHVATQHHCAVPLDNDTFARDFTCTSIHVPCSRRYSS